MAIIEIAGLAVSAVGLLTDLFGTYRDLAEWDEQDVEVDDDWLQLALSRGLLSGSPNDFGWMNARRVPSAELRGTHNVVIALNKDKRIKYRVVRGSEARGETVNILVKKGS